MRIAFFSDNAYPELSGIVDSITTVGKALVGLGHEVTYVGPYYPDRVFRETSRSYIPHGSHELVEDMPMVRLTSLPLPHSPTGQSRIALSFGQSFRYFDTHRPDIVHTHSPYGAGKEALRVAKRYNVPLIGTNHTAVEDFFPAFLAERERGKDARYYNNCAFVSAPYAKLLERMKEKGFAQPHRAVPNPTDVGLFAPIGEFDKEVLKQTYKLSGPVVLYAGRLAPEKRVDVTLEAMAHVVRQCPDATLVITGQGSADASLRARAAGLGIAGSVRFTGFIPPHALVHYYQAADAFVLLSTSDSQSLSLMQAYAVGIPVVGARARGLPDYITQETGFLVEPGDAIAASEHILRLIRDKDLRTRLGTAGRTFVERFAPPIVAREWEEIYEREAGKR